jgi:peptide/nickel transport system substrate-binding protein
MAAFGAYIVPEGSEDFTKPVGSGAFSFASFQPGRSTLLKRNLDYWDGPPHLDELEFVIANEESARINALLGGQGVQAFAMKVDRPPFNDPGLREAMFLLADRRQLVDTVMPGAGQVGNDLYGKGYEYYADDIPQCPRP